MAKTDRITFDRLARLRDELDDELCIEPEVWIDLLKEEGLPVTMTSVRMWIAPPHCKE